MSDLINSTAPFYDGDFTPFWKKLIREVCGPPKCSRCGYEKCARAIEFHHVGPKKFGIAEWRRKPITPTNKEAFVEELKQCVMLCSNCHREVHDAIFRRSLQRRRKAIKWSSSKHKFIPTNEFRKYLYGD